MDRLQATLHKRRSIKGSLTRLCRKIESISEDALLPEITALLKQLLGVEENYELLFELIEELASDEDLEAHAQDREEFLSRVQEVKDKLRSLFHNVPTSVSSVSGDETSPTLTNISVHELLRQQNSMLDTLKRLTEVRINETNSVSTPSNVKLPSFNVPKFNGSYREWLAFKDLFVATIHNNATLEPAQKLQYLKSALVGEAACVLKHFSITNSNYDPAWKELELRYGRKQIIIDSHLASIFNLKPLTRASASDIKILTSTLTESVQALKALELKVEHWDAMLIYLVCTKLDPDSHQLWSRKCSSSDTVTYAKLVEFLYEREYELQTQPRQVKHVTNEPKRQDSRRLVHVSSVAENKQSCPQCKGQHLLSSCSVFKSLSQGERKAFVTKLRLCFNCFSPQHLLPQCLKPPCKICNKPHHSLLHIEKTENTSNPTAYKSLCMSKKECSNVYLPTAEAHAVVSGAKCPVRILLDTGSEISLISEACVSRLGLSREFSKLKVSGISAKNAVSTCGLVSLTIEPKDSVPCLSLKAHVLSKLTSLVPKSTYALNYDKNISELPLADTMFNKPRDIDLILGVDCMHEVLKPGLRKFSSAQIVAQETIFGWVLFGSAKSSNAASAQVNFVQTEIEVGLKKFWELESVANRNENPSLDDPCEVHFRNTHERFDNGQYMVRLPKKKSPDLLGTTFQGALNRLFSLERKLSKDSDLKNSYTDFMTEYEELGHMQKVAIDPSSSAVYLPHHAVVKESSSTTKVRVVFNASFPSTTRTSLNDILLPGPKLQLDIFDVLLRFRTHKYAFCADICKMYRMILVDPRDRALQQILWRENPEKQVEAYQLNTVTYGTSSAPFLAIRTLMQLAQDEKSVFPKASDCVHKNFYVDDILCGSQNVEETKDLIAEVQMFLQRGAFTLRKFSSNNSDCLANVSESDRESNTVHNISGDESVKTLGISWCTKNDTFCFEHSFCHKMSLTKRQILSEICGIFDPLGLLAPITIRLKILMQDLWLTTANWDDTLPACILESWNVLVSELKMLSSFKIPRWLMVTEETFELYGFSDASEKAYAAVIYARNSSSDTLRLLCCKTKVSPLKRLTIPKLELCASHLLVKLLVRVCSVLNVLVNNCKLYTDSTIVLCWLSVVPKTLPVFIGNRTSDILSVTDRSQWHHVPSQKNPADIASRGCSLESLKKSELWLSGPDLKALDTDNQPSSQFFEHDNVLTDERPEALASIDASVNFTQTLSDILTVCERFCSFTMIVRVVAWCKRFIAKLKHKTDFQPFLTSEEYKSAILTLVKCVQIEAFAKELDTLKKGHTIQKGSSIALLNPFLDSKSIVRVGGRIQNENSEYHQIILPKRHIFTMRLVQYMHRKNLHAGPRHLIALLMREYWILGIRAVVKNVCLNCVICTKLKAKVSSQKMGMLPVTRTTPSRPFQYTGVDFGGPISIKTWKGKSAKSIKSYIALFVCFATKAIHLELVTELSSDALVAALRRFIARRSQPHVIYSDNGRNFVGVSNMLREFYELLNTSQTQDKINSFLTEQTITWKFIPPYAPHFGGIWEAGIKSAKFHMKRVIGEARLTFEELYTVLCDIEACLNTRPLQTYFDELGGFEVLTPGHFLLGSSLNVIPETERISLAVDNRTRWQYLQTLRQNFWKTWSKSYLQDLQVAKKYIKENAEIKENSVVVVKEDFLPAGRWLLGRVTSVVRGPDDLVRVANIQTKNGQIRRPVTKLVLLPIEPVEP